MAAHHQTNYQPTNYQLAYMFFRKQLEQLVKTTSYFSPRNRAAILKSGADLSATALAKAGCARMARVVFISCHGCFLFNETYPHLHSVRNTHHQTNYQLPTTNYQPKTFRLLFHSRRRFDILILLRLEERSNIAWGRDPSPGGPTGSASELQTLSLENHYL